MGSILHIDDGRYPVFHINSKTSSYIIGVLETGQPEHLYYGSLLRPMQDYSVLRQKNDVPYGSMVYPEEKYKNIGLDDQCLEYSSPGRGDYREAAMELVFADGCNTCNFVYASHKTYAGRTKLEGLPCPRGSESNAESLELSLIDELYGVELVLSYSCYPDYDIITRSARLYNHSQRPVRIKRLMSSQLDLFCGDWNFITFDGAWAFERKRHERLLQPGIYTNDSKTGNSSNRHNPFVMLSAPDCGEFFGACYGFNLFYSGNHAEIAEKTFYGKTRLLTGINPSGFEWLLEPGASFGSPEAILSYSAGGFNKLSQSMHRFIEELVVPEAWVKKERPVLANNWEATFFDFDKAKILSMAKEAAKLGVELFVLDDGWFGQRNDDTKGLGDWTVNKKKLPGGLGALAAKINALGLKFGIWVEPEMANEDSDLYRAHPDWILACPGRKPAYGRNQFVLDLCRKEVRDYIIEAMTAVFSSANIEYVKWDMNRNISDPYSESLAHDRQGEVPHRYMLGLYEVMDVLTKRFPGILFESCASGGNRFDLGMLVYMPQIWTSDGTDAYARLSIQGGSSYGYPPSVMGAHVSDSPNMQTLRAAPLETRFNVAAFGLLGYEMDLGMLSAFDKKAIKEQIAFYKANRQLLQFGRFYRSCSKEDKDKIIWTVVSDDQERAISSLFQGMAKPGRGQDVLAVPGLSADKNYSIRGRKQYINVKAFGNLVNHVLPFKIRGDGIAHTLISSHYMYEMAREDYTAGGDLLSGQGIVLLQQFSGTGHNDRIRILSDYGSRIYVIKANPDNEH